MKNKNIKQGDTVYMINTKGKKMSTAYEVTQLFSQNRFAIAIREKDTNNKEYIVDVSMVAK